MKQTGKIITSLILLVSFLSICLILVSFGYFGAWLHTYKAFTAKTKVAEITISEQKEDDLGEYFEVEYTPVKNESALVKWIAPGSGKSDELEKPQTFKLYGDTVHIGGPIIKFKDELILFNFKSIFKIGKIYARYNIDNELEQSRTPEMASSFDLNGGIDQNWQDIHNNLTNDNLKGGFYRSFVDTTQISTPGQFVSNKKLKYTLYITNNGFLWKLEE